MQDQADIAQNKFIPKDFSVTQELNLDNNIYKYTGENFDVKKEIEKDNITQPAAPIKP